MQRGHTAARAGGFTRFSRLRRDTARRTRDRVKIDCSQLTFLLVEDSAYMRGILRAMLQGFGARRIYDAEDGAAGLEMLDRVSPDILIVDWVMPVLDGLEMVRLIRQPDHPMAFIPIILVTAHTEKKRILTARNAGVHEVLSKPVSATALYQRISSVVTQPREFVRSEAYFGPKLREELHPAQRPSPMQPPASAA
jgi:CheY-like chemotaxis protein